jgi:hypothetical protein
MLQFELHIITSPLPTLGWNGTESTITQAITGVLYQLWMMMDDEEYGAVGGMLGRVNRSARRKLSPVPLWPPQIPHDLILARTLATTVGSQRLIV